jgi:predicted DNA binding CopG/RHH family protein
MKCNQLSLRVESAVLAELKTEAERMGIPYQAFIGSILHRYVHYELIDRKTVALLKDIKAS